MGQVDLPSRWSPSHPVAPVSPVESQAEYRQRLEKAGCVGIHHGWDCAWVFTLYISLFARPTSTHRCGLLVGRQAISEVFMTTWPLPHTQRYSPTLSRPRHTHHTHRSSWTKSTATERGMDRRGWKGMSDDVRCLPSKCCLLLDTVLSILINSHPPYPHAQDRQRVPWEAALLQTRARPKPLSPAASFPHHEAQPSGPWRA